MEIREDLEFTFQENKKTIYANKSANYLFLHPEFYNHEQEKIVANLENININKNHGSNELMIIKKIKNWYVIVKQTKAFIENEGNIISDNLTLKKIYDYGHFSIYNSEKMKAAIIVSDTGYYYIIQDLDDISYGILFEYLFVITKRYKNGYFVNKIYNRYFQLITTKDAVFSLSEIADIVNYNKIAEKQDLNAKLALYKRFLENLLRKYLKNQNIEKLPKENLLKLGAEIAIEHNLNLVINLETYEIYNGRFRKCFQVETDKNSIWINNLEELENLTESYKRERIKKESV